MHSLRVILSFLLTLGVALAQQQSVPSTVAQFPSCARACVVDAFEGGLCSPTDRTCVCTDEAFQGNVTACVTASCQIPDILLTKNTTLTQCGATPRDRSGSLVAIGSSMAIIAVVFVIARFCYNILVLKVELRLDDWLLLTTMLSCLPSAFINVYGLAANGLGKDIWVLSATEITNVLFYFYLMAWMYFMETTLVKLTIISFYLRIFPTRSTRRLLWCTFIFTTLFGLAYVIASIFQCRPVHYFWTMWDGLHDGHCLDINAIAWSNAAINIALDLWVLAIPLWELRTLQLHWKKKIGVALMFCVGTFVTVVSILRLQSLITFGRSANSSWDFYDVSLWSTIEITVGIMCACLPTLRLMLVRLFPILAGSTGRRNGSYYQHHRTGNSVPSKVVDRRGHTTNVITTERRKSSTDSEKIQGIELQKTFHVQYDNDEANLIPLEGLNGSGKRSA